MIDIDAIRRDYSLPPIAAKVATLRPAGKEWVACCPFHADRSPSFTIFDGGRRFHCFGCGASGDVLDFVQRAYGVTLTDAARMLGAGDISSKPQPAPRPAAPADRSGEALAIWEQAIPAAGTLAEAYLGFRGISPPLPPDMRFTRLPYGNRATLPCLVAADLPKPKLSLGKVAGGAIRLGDLNGAGMVTVCEGPEDGLSLLKMLGGPVWVAAGATMLPAMQFPPEVRSIVIGADNDPAGERAAHDAARAFAARGLFVRIIRPLDGFKDWNDELQGER
jgi:DNA primase